MIELTATEKQELRSKNYNAELTSVRLAHRELGFFTVKPDKGVPPHRAGQYLTLGLGLWEPRVASASSDLASAPDLSKVLRRAYSISHPILDDAGDLLPPHRGVLDFYIVLVGESSSGGPAGLTPRLFRLNEGDRLQVGERITGHFTLAGVQPTDTVVFLATGTGEAPHNYMIWELLSNQHAGPIVAVCCARLKSDLGYLLTHERLMARYPNYHYVPLTTREPLDLGKKVYIQGLLESGALETQTGVHFDPGDCHVFLCGNPKMIGVPVYDRATGAKVYPQPPGCVELLERRGFQSDVPGQKQRGNIHFEEYW